MIFGSSAQIWEGGNLISEATRYPRHRTEPRPITMCCAGSHSGQDTYRLLLSVIPSMKKRWKKRKTITTGKTTKQEAAISRLN